MTIRKEKKNALTERSGNNREMVEKRPFDLWTDIDRMFNDFRSDFTNLFWPWSQRNELTNMIPTKTPPMNIADLGDRYEMHVEIPGIPKENINIEVTPNSIEISGQHEESKENKRKNWIQRECNCMRYYRSLDFPEEVKSNDVNAEMKKGILTIMLPKVKPRPEQKPKKVTIK
jgi:HSP20 family protein